MRLRLAVVLALFIPAGTFCSAAYAADSDTSERLAYSLMLGGLKVGDAVVSMDINSTAYNTNIKMTSTGALKMLSSLRAELHVQGKIEAQNALVMVPSSFENLWTAGDIAGKMTMTFDPTTHAASTHERIFNPTTGEDVKREDLPWNKRAKMVDVPVNMRTNAFDPMTAFLAGRRQVILANGQPGATFRVPIFDGSRRYDVVGKIGAVKSLSINGTEQNVLPIQFAMQPVFGFLPQAEEKMKDWDVKAYFTPDKRMVPVQIVIASNIMSAVMNLSADCNKEPEACATVEAAAPIDPQQAEVK